MTVFALNITLKAGHLSCTLGNLFQTDCGLAKINISASAGAVLCVCILFKSLTFILLQFALALNNSGKH